MIKILPLAFVGFTLNALALYAQVAPPSAVFPSRASTLTDLQNTPSTKQNEAEIIAMESRDLYILYATDTRFAGGAKCDSKTDDYLALQAVAAYAATLHGATIQLPPTGSACLTSHSIVAPSNVVFRGAAFGYSGIAAKAGGSFSTYVSGQNGVPHTYLASTGGVTNSYILGSRFESMTLNGNGLVDTVFYNVQAEEQSGVFDVALTNCTVYCADMQGFGTQNFAGFINDTFGQANGYTRPTIGINFVNANQREVVDRCTFNFSSGHGNIGINLGGGSNVAVTNDNFQNLTTAVKVGSTATVYVLNSELFQVDGIGVYITAGGSAVISNLYGQYRQITDCNVAGCPTIGKFSATQLYVSSAAGVFAPLDLPGTRTNTFTGGIEAPFLQGSGAALKFKDGSIQFMGVAGTTPGAVSSPPPDFTLDPPLTFSALTSAPNGHFLFCLDCRVTSSTNNTCTGGGSGSPAFKSNGAWKCM